MNDNPFRIISRGKRIDEYLSKLGPDIVSLFSTLRMRIGERYADVAEDVREHRIVFGRKTPLRWFLDAMPTKDGIVLSMPPHSASGSLPQKMSIRQLDELEGALASIDNAYRSV